MHAGTLHKGNGILKNQNTIRRWLAFGLYQERIKPLSPGYIELLCSKNSFDIKLRKICELHVILVLCSF